MNAMSFERAEEYRLMAGRLHALAAGAKQPEVRAELGWLAQSYERLAMEPDRRSITEGHRSLRVPEGPRPSAEPAN
jgi:Ser/Thr protein kinase RdoA (MazF antagonist)